MNKKILDLDIELTLKAPVVVLLYHSAPTTPHLPPIDVVAAHHLSQPF